MNSELEPQEAVEQITAEVLPWAFSGYLLPLAHNHCPLDVTTLLQTYLLCSLHIQSPREHL